MFFIDKLNEIIYCGVEKLVSQLAHNQKFTGSSPVSATNLRINYPKAGWFETSDRLWCNGHGDRNWSSGLRFDSLLTYKNVL